MPLTSDAALRPQMPAQQTALSAPATVGAAGGKMSGTSGAMASSAASGAPSAAGASSLAGTQAASGTQGMSGVQAASGTAPLSGATPAPGTASASGASASAGALSPASPQGSPSSASPQGTSSPASPQGSSSPGGEEGNAAEASEPESGREVKILPLVPEESYVDDSRLPEGEGAAEPLDEEFLLVEPESEAELQERLAAQQGEKEKEPLSLKDFRGTLSDSIRSKLRQLEEGEADEGRDEYWDEVLTGNPDTVPDHVRSITGADDASLPFSEREYRLCSAINRSWAVDYLGLTRESLRSSWGSCRAALADALGVSNNEQEIFAALSLRHREVPRRRLLRRVFEKSYLAGLEGKDFPPPVEEEVMAGGVMDEELRRQSQELSRAAYRQGDSTRQKWLPLAKHAARSLDFFSAVEEDVFYQPRGLSALPAMKTTLEQMSELDEHDRQIVLHVTRSLFEKKKPENLLPTMGRAFQRGRVNLGAGLVNLAGQTSAVLFQQPARFFDGWVGRNSRRASEKTERYVQIFNELKNLQQNEVQPLDLRKGAGWAEHLLVEAAEATPMAVLSCCGGVGFGTVLCSSVGDSVAEARRRAPEGSRELQLCAGVLAGAVQAGIFRGINRVGGKVLENSIAGLMKARGAGMSRFSMAGLNFLSGASLEGARQLLAGKAAAGADLGMQELAARLEGTASNINWEEFGSSFVDIETNMREAARVLPFILIGSGKLTLRHFRSERSILGDEGYILREWGIDEKARRAIMQEQNRDKRSEMLRLELQRSYRWQSPEFRHEAARALRLLNLDYFEGFRDEEVVREFLQLPSEGSKVVRSEYENLNMEEAGREPSHGMSRFERGNFRQEKMKEVFDLWNSWWRRSHIREHTASSLLDRAKADYVYWDKPTLERIGAYQEDIRKGNDVVPYRMRNTGVYAPFAEAERRALLRDRVAETHDLSYQFLMNVYSLDSLLANPSSSSTTKARVEATRNIFLGEIGKAVLRSVMGMSRSESLDQLDSYFSNYYLRRGYRGFPAAWMKSFSPKIWNHLPEKAADYANPSWWNQTDIMQTFRIVSGGRSCASALMDLLPMTDDFQTALSRGMSPARAMEHLLVRELGYDSSSLKGYPTNELEASRNVTDYRRYTRDNAHLFRLYQQMTGVELESQSDASGVEYYRVLRPDGRYTRWHRGAPRALNDLAANTSLRFVPFGEGHYRWMQQLSSAEDLDLLRLNQMYAGEFSGYDQLCGIATRELASMWMDTSTTMQPGVSALQLRKIFPRLHRVNDATSPAARRSAVRDSLEEPASETPMGDLEAVPYTGVTPLALIQGRSYTYWTHMLNSYRVSEGEARDFLVRQGVSVPEELSRHELIENLTHFTTHYFLSNLNRMDVPDSVRRWYATAAFCPPPGAPPVERFGRKSTLPSGEKGLKLMNWANRRVALELREMAPEVSRMRERYATSGLENDSFFEVFSKVFDVDARQQYEQGWGFHLGGDRVLLQGQPYAWELVNEPLRIWKRLSPEEKLDVCRQTQRFFLQKVPGSERGDELANGQREAQGNERRDSRKNARSAAPEKRSKQPAEEPSDEAQRAAVEAAVSNLDAVLKDYPELHRYALPGMDSNRLYMLTLQESRPGMGRWDEPTREPVPTYRQTEMQPGFKMEIVEEVPAFVKEDARVLPALRFLGGLRSLVTELPCATPEGIWWKQRVYGGEQGMHPAGLEQWKASRPLEPMLRLLEKIDGRKGRAVEICGVRVRGLNPEELDLSELNAITVYHSGAREPFTYRLMPGETEAGLAAARTPYIVHSRYGFLSNDQQPIEDITHQPESIIRLQDFWPIKRRLYSESTLRTLAERNSWMNTAPYHESSERESFQYKYQCGRHRHERDADAPVRGFRLHARHQESGAGGALLRSGTDAESGTHSAAGYLLPEFRHQHREACSGGEKASGRPGGSAAHHRDHEGLPD